MTLTQALQLRLLPRLAAPNQTSKACQRRRRAPPGRLARSLAPSTLDLDLGPVLNVRHALLQPAQHAHLHLWHHRRVRRRQPDAVTGYNPATTTAATAIWCRVERERERGFAV